MSVIGPNCSLGCCASITLMRMDIPASIGFYIEIIIVTMLIIITSRIKLSQYAFSYKLTQSW